MTERQTVTTIEGCIFNGKATCRACSRTVAKDPTMWGVCLVEDGWGYIQGTSKFFCPDHWPEGEFMVSAKSSGAVIEGDCYEVRSLESIPL